MEREFIYCKKKYYYRDHTLSQVDDYVSSYLEIYRKKLK